MADTTLQSIKDRLDVVEVISSYIATKKSGTNYKATCPFHNEKSASFMISPQKQIWHCFGCGEGGDIFGFVMRFENLDFREALQQLAHKAGVQLPDRATAGKQVDKKLTEDLIRINSFTAKFYHSVLATGQGAVAKQYILDRGLNEATVANWEIGFAPNSFDAIIKALQSKNVTSHDALAAGVVAKNDRGTIFDRFRNRLTFPIRNYYGDVVGFTARVLPGADEKTGKYINSPETAIYNKSKVLFGLHASKNAIRKSDEAVIVEGQMDCIAAHQAGYNNTVATSGTALTEDHLRLIGRLTKNLKFCFDSDSAGMAALRRAGELALQMGFRVKVIALPNHAKDPDELLRLNPGLWRKVVADSVWFIDYYIQRAEQTSPFGSLEQKQNLIEEVIPLLKFVTNALEQGHYIRMISERFAVTENEIRAVLSSSRLANASGIGNAISPVAQQRVPAGEPVAPAPHPIMVTQENIQEKEILGGLRLYPEYREFVAAEGLSSEYISEGMRAIINAALIHEPLPPELQSPSLESLAKEAEFMVESNLEKLDNNELALMRELKKSFYLFKKAGINTQLQNATTAIKKAESMHDNSAVKQYTELFAELSAARYALEQKLES